VPSAHRGNTGRRSQCTYGRLLKSLAGRVERIVSCRTAAARQAQNIASTADPCASPLQKFCNCGAVNSKFDHSTRQRLSRGFNPRLPSLRYDAAKAQRANRVHHDSEMIEPFSNTSRAAAASRCPSPCGRLARRAIFRFTETPNQWLNSGHPVPTRGAVARRHERGMGCGGRESVGAQVRSQGELNLVSD
jgi:hypothetical protein